MLDIYSFEPAGEWQVAGRDPTVSNSRRRVIAIALERWEALRAKSLRGSACARNAPERANSVSNVRFAARSTIKREWQEVAFHVGSSMPGFRLPDWSVLAAL
jgi:hypothetical protein